MQDSMLINVFKVLDNDTNVIVETKEPIKVLIRKIRIITAVEEDGGTTISYEGYNTVINYVCNNKIEELL